MLSLVAVRTVDAGPIYVYKQSDGTIRFSSKPPPSGTDAQVFTAKNKNYSMYRGIGKSRRSGKLFRERYWKIIESTTFRYGVDPHLIQAVIHVESAFNPRAVSPKGAMGLMQIMPFNFKKLGVKEPFEPHDNIRGGVKLLSYLLKKYKNNISLALAAYNAGEEAVQKYKGVPPYTETQNYVKKVISFQRRYSL